MIIVTGPTGQIGSQVVEKLLAADAAVRVIARDPATLPTAIRGAVEVVQGSHGDAATVGRAFAGAEAVFWLVPPDPQASSVDAAYVDFSRPAYAAFRAAGVTHVVGVSSLGRGKPQAGRAGMITASLKMDDLIAGSGVNYRALTMPPFMDNLLRQAATIRDRGVFTDAVPGDLKMATCATRDIAATTAHLLLDRSWGGAGEVPVVAPEELSPNEMARIMSEVLDRPVRFEEMAGETLLAGLLARGRSVAMAEGIVDMMMAARAGIYSDAPRTSPITAPTSFRQWCEEVLRPALRG